MMSAKGSRKGWPSRPPRKGTKSRDALIRCLKGIKRRDLYDLYSDINLNSWICTMFNEKGIEIRSVKGTLMVVGFMRSNGRYRQAPGSVSRILKIHEEKTHG
jgi:hypothetical protein